MPRISRSAPGGMVYHVLNRGVAWRSSVFDEAPDYAAFVEIILETFEKTAIRICSYCLMPDHWHLVLWPEHDGQLAEFMQRLTVTHVTRWQWHHGRVGEGHVYQGRFKSFPVETDGKDKGDRSIKLDPNKWTCPLYPLETDDYFYQVMRYVERNALRANLVEHAEDWQWCSLWRRQSGNVDLRRLLAKWPLPQPRDWVRRVNAPQTEAELAALRRSVSRGQPYGSACWTQAIAQQLGLESTLRPRGRPAKRTDTQ